MRATDLAHLLAQRADAVCQHLLPNGIKKARHWCVGSVGGEAGDSLRVCIVGSACGRWADFGGGADERGDLVGLWKRVRNLDLNQACREAADWLGGDVVQTPEVRERAPRIETRAPSQTWLRLQTRLRRPSFGELNQIADLRGLPGTAGLELASRHGQLFCAEVFDDGFEWASWIVTDASRRNAQARRMDGQPWSGIGGKKAKTIAGCEASWPIGCAGLDVPNVALVEGGPDFLAAWHLIWDAGRIRDTRPIAMLGAGQPIHPEALALFSGRTITLMPHIDDNGAGEGGAEHWATQLRPVAAEIKWLDLRPSGVKDLNELVLAEGRGDE